MKKKTQKVSIVTGLLALFLVIIHVANKIIFFTSTLKEVLYRNNSKYYNWRFGKVSYTCQGSGAPVLLIHDLTSMSSSYEFKDLAKRLAQTNTVYTIDLIGCGRSDKPRITYTNYLYVQLISDFIKNIIKDETTIVTSGRSCSIGIMASYIDSSLFNKIVLINPIELARLSKCPKRKHKILKCLLNIPVLGTLLYNINNNRYHIKSKFNQDYLNAPLPILRYVDAYSEAAHTSGSASKYVYTSIRCHYANTNIVHALKDIPNSITILAGSNVDQIQKIVEEYQHYNPSIKAVYIDQTKGMPHIEKPSKCSELIQNCL